MAARPARIAGWTAQHVRHAAGVLRQGGNPAARVYESIGPDFFLAVAPGWLNRGCGRGRVRSVRPSRPAAGWSRRSPQHCPPAG